MPRHKKTDAVVRELRAFGLAYPGAHTKSPWPGHLDLAVNDKTFAYLSLEGQPLGVSCKLPTSGADALMLPFVKPAGYGLGKSGWVAASFEEGDELPVPMLKEWIDESYRAQAPKRLIATLDGPQPAKPAPKKKTAAKKTPAAKK
jgi:predicted DNA-binding protein (MmcQ/YjbR family)